MGLVQGGYGFHRVSSSFTIQWGRRVQEVALPPRLHNLCSYSPPPSIVRAYPAPQLSAKQGPEAELVPL